MVVEGFMRNCKIKHLLLLSSALGDGTDDLTLVGSGSEDSNISNFETLTMNGSEWTLSGVNSFTTIALNSGSLTNVGTLSARKKQPTSLSMCRI